MTWAHRALIIHPMPRAIGPTSTASRRQTKREYAELLADETCPGRCEWEDVEYVELKPHPAHHHRVYRLHQTCANCDFERYIQSPQLEQLGQVPVNVVPRVMREFIRG